MSIMGKALGTLGGKAARHCRCVLPEDTDILKTGRKGWQNLLQKFPSPSYLSHSQTLCPWATPGHQWGWESDSLAFPVFTKETEVRERSGRVLEFRSQRCRSQEDTSSFRTSASLSEAGNNGAFVGLLWGLNKMQSTWVSQHLAYNRDSMCSSSLLVYVPPSYIVSAPGEYGTMWHLWLWQVNWQANLFCSHYRVSLLFLILRG